MVPIGNMKLRRRQYVVGTSGVVNVDSRQMKTTAKTAAATPAAITAGDVQPTMGPMLNTSMAAVTPPARLQLPTQSMPSQTRDRLPRPFPSEITSAGEFRRARLSDGSKRATTTEAMIRSTSWPQNSVRHPKNWITGEPSVTPRTGPPAPTSDHHPSALTRSSFEKSSRMIAMDAVPVAAPCTPSRARANSSMPTLGAVAVRIGADHGPDEPELIQPPMAEEVPGLAEERGGDAEGEQRAGRSPGEHGEVGVEVRLYRRKGDDEHGKGDVE